MRSSFLGRPRFLPGAFVSPTLGDESLAASTSSSNRFFLGVASYSYFPSQNSRF